MGGEFPAEGMELTHLLVVSDADRARDFYRDVLGAELYREYGGTSVVLRFLGSWLLLVTGGGPTPDKPEVIEVQRDVVRSNPGAQQRCCLIVRRPKVWELV